MLDQIDPYARDIAIIGMAGRFPDAGGVPKLWELLLAGREAVRHIGEPAQACVSAGRSTDPLHVPYGASLADADLFDAAFFGMSPRDASLMDPQHRVFLTCAWEALEDAGLAVDERRNIGVYAASSPSTYLLFHVLQSAAHVAGALADPTLLGNDKDCVATNTASLLGLRGPALAVQSACSSSLMAVRLACQALIDGEVDAALAGGVSITFPQGTGYRYREGGTLSRDGHCRVFDKNASGTVKGNGCGTVVLKRYTDAWRDGDRIYAVIRGTAANNTGSAAAGSAARVSEGQLEVIRRALARSGVPASDIGYVETHCTGEAVRDQQELSAMSAAHRGAGGPAPTCLIGSLKANLGHLDAAAGVTALIKTALVLHHQTVPPQINLVTPHPSLRLGELPYQIPSGATPYENGPLRAAAVSSFGIGGTNVHCILQRAPLRSPRRPLRPGMGYPILLSARDTEALMALASRLRQWVETASSTCLPYLPDLAYTLFDGRPRLAVRHTFTATGLSDLRNELDMLLAHGVANGELPPATAGPLPAARKISLPGHPMRPVRHWIEPDNPRLVPPGASHSPVMLYQRAR
ncbi:beta-ketoacyl synthase N-terminal-like domain-containing protein [Streptomyces sp. NPDC059070]|uniref:beta-ketoacyl synthase N-terminal-like domain-containing protein n=1 Tax=Streptomyces sp. NPDC059070 TaxID=3346713 RepID=UPI0036C82FD4